MKLSLILSLLLLSTVSSLHLKNEALELEESEGEKALVKDLEMPEEGDNLALGDEEKNDEEEEVEVAEDDANLCPKEENVVRVPGRPGCKNCGFLIVNQARDFNGAQQICRSCYHGHLVSIHNFFTNFYLQCSARGINLSQIWIGAKVGHTSCNKFQWVDGSCWTYSNWAAGEPRPCGGKCASLCTQGGHWHTAPCCHPLPFACSY